MSNIEEWRDTQYLHIQVSNAGNVRNSYTKEKLKCNSRTKGYPVVNVGKREGYTGHNEYIHRLVALAFIPNPNGESDVNHKDGNKENIHVSNLEWCSRSENIAHAYRIGLREAAYNPDSIAVEAYVYPSMEYIDTYESQAAAARALDVTGSKVCEVVNGGRRQTKGYYFVKARSLHEN